MISSFDKKLLFIAWSILILVDGKGFCQIGWEKLIIFPERYHGTEITIDGVLEVDLNQSGNLFTLWKDSESRIWDKFESSIRLESASFTAYLAKVQPEKQLWARLNGAHVIVTAIFDNREEKWVSEVGAMKKPSLIRKKAVNTVDLFE